MKTNIDIIYSDETLVVVNKPGALLSVPGRGPENKDCVSSRLQSLFPDMIEQPAVHRLFEIQPLEEFALAGGLFGLPYPARQPDRPSIAVLERSGQFALPTLPRD